MFLINLQGKDSIYEQIKSQIEKFIKNGIIKPGDKLPSVRKLAEELGINPNTVVKAYQKLEDDKLIYTVNKKGVFVADGNEEEKNSHHDDALSLLTMLKAEGVSRERLLKIIDEVYGEGGETC